MSEITRSNVLSAVRQAWDRSVLSMRALALRGMRFDYRRLVPGSPSPRLVKLAAIAAGVAAVGVIACSVLWWRLSSGPLSVDIVTPWLTSALEQKLGHGYRVEVGGTVLERDEEGRTALRLQDVIVRDAGGNVVANAPKADVGINSSGLITGQVRAERLSLIGAEMSVRVESDGRLTVFAGAGGERPLASVAPAPPAPAAPAASSPAIEPAKAEPSLLMAVVGWLQSLDGVGLDGRDLVEIGLKSGSLSVADERSGKQLRFEHINLSLTRLKQGGAALAISSLGADGPWSLSATVAPGSDGSRSLEAVVRDVSPTDLMLALRVEGNLRADIPLSAVVRAEFAPDGTLRMLQGRVLGGAGHLGDLGNPASRMLIDEVQADLRWDPAQHALNVPIEVHAGPSRIALLAQVNPPREDRKPWTFAITHGMIALASSERRHEAPLILDRISARATLDTVKRQLVIEQLDARGVGAGVAISGAVRYAEEKPRLAVGVAGTPMSAIAFKRLWPAFIAPHLHTWFEKNLHGGTVERMVIGTNMALASFRSDGPLIPEDGLSIEIASRATTISPVSGLPPIQDAELTTRITGTTATIKLARGRVDLPSGRKLVLTNGMFEVPDVNADPVFARSTFAVEGPVEAVAELLAMEPVRDAAQMPFDLKTAQGAVVAQVGIGLPLGKTLGRNTVRYVVEAKINRFEAASFWRGQKAEADELRVSASRDLLEIRGDMRIGGAPAAVDYRRARGAADAEVRIQTTLDDAARSRLGLSLGSGLSGAVPVTLSGRMGGGTRGDLSSRLTVEADLTPARVNELVPGWSKSPGRPARASFVLVEKERSFRLEDLAVEGSGVALKGTIEVEPSGELVSANLPTFAPSDGDRASLRAERTGDGTLRLMLRGDVYDGRGLIKSAVSGQQHDKRADRAPDLDLDIKVGAMTGYHGEALRSLEVRLTRRGGHIRTFALSGKLGRDARVRGELRPRGGGQVMYLETGDAGAFFRFTDIYPRIFGGTASVAMDPPVLDNTPREGLLNIHNFVVRGEPVLEQVAAGNADPSFQAGPGRPRNGAGVGFTRLRAEFTRSPGRFSIRDGLVWGPAIGATVEGGLDYAREEVRLRGTFVPAYALNNMLARVPILGFFLGGGENEGLLGVTYQVVGSPAAPILQVNPMSAIAPGFLRKLFEFRGGGERTGQVPDTVR